MTGASTQLSFGGVNTFHVINISEQAAEGGHA